MSDQDTRDRRQRKRQLANKKHHHYGKRQAKPKQYGEDLREHPVNVRNWETYRNDD